MTKRLSGLVLIVASGCVFTPRPMIPFGPDGGDITGATGDAGQAAASDVGGGTPSLDAGTGFLSDGSAADAAPGVLDSRCHRESDAGDAGYVDENGSPCDPTEVGDGGGRDAARPTCDAVADAAADAVTDAMPACDGGVSPLPARGLR